jgi:hypothetical protein
MLPLIFSAGGGKEGIFTPFYLGIRIISLCCLKNMGEFVAARKIMYCIECKGENYVINTEEFETSGGGEHYRYLLFCWRALEQVVCKMSPI